MQASRNFKMVASEGWINWFDIKDRVDLAAVVTRLLGPAAKRVGSRLLWCCPFHEDQDPSFQVDLNRKSWRCWVCAIGGDAAELVKRVNKCDFPTAVRFLADEAGVVDPQSQSRVQKSKNPISWGLLGPGLGDQPSGLFLEEAIDLVNGSTSRLWGPGGKTALAYLHGRGLTDATIRSARLGWTPHVMIPTKDGDRVFAFSGITIPWIDGDRLTRIKIRRLDDRKPKYAEAYADCPLIYPDPAVIEPGRPLIVCEGEFDAILMGQQLPEASVITLGSAAARTDPSVLNRMLSAPRWFAALDADQAGDSAAAKFPARAVRVRPPDGVKDWTDLHRAAPNGIRYHWGRLLGHSLPWDRLEPKGELRPVHDPEQN